MVETKLAEISGSDHVGLPFGTKVRYSRQQIHMSAEQSGILYAKAIGREKPYTGRRMEQMEFYDDFPQDRARRWAIAKIVRMGLFFTLDPELEMTFPHKTSPMKKKRRILIDIHEYETQLRTYWENGVTGTLEEAMSDITERIYTLHDNVLYMDRAQKRTMLRALCGYNIMAAQVLEEQKRYISSQRYFDRAIILARENQYIDLHAMALHRRAAHAVDQGQFAEALLDYQATLSLQTIPPQLRGHILSVAAEAKAGLAHSQREMDEAIRLQEEAGKLVGQNSLSDFDYLVSFDEGRHLLNMGATYMKAPTRALRSPDKALEFLPPLSTAPDLSHWQTYRQVFNHIIQAWVHLDQHLYPVAATLAEDALALLERIPSKVHLDELVDIYEALKQSPYGSSTEVTLLEIGLMRNMQPELFN